MLRVLLVTFSLVCVVFFLFFIFREDPYTPSFQYINSYNEAERIVDSLLPLNNGSLVVSRISLFKFKNFDDNFKIRHQYRMSSLEMMEYYKRTYAQCNCFLNWEKAYMPKGNFRKKKTTRAEDSLYALESIKYMDSTCNIVLTKKFYDSCVSKWH